VSYATAWKEWFPLIERAGAPLSRRMIALASLEERDFVLDIGTGIGEPALMAARSLPNGRVLAIDPDAGMIEIARERAKSEKIGNVTFLVRTVEELNLPPESVDAILCRWSLMFVDDPDAALAKLFRLLRPAGRLVAGTWGPPDRVPALSLARAVVHSFFGMDPPRYGPKTAFALSDSDVLAARFRAAGFSEVAQEWVPLAYEFPSEKAYIQFRVDCTGPLFATVGELSAAAQERALEAIAAALEPFRAVDGSVLLTNDACCTVGKA
jgi:enediyne biosynthesis protein CalE5